MHLFMFIYLTFCCRRITTINKWMRDNNYDVDKMWRDIDDVIIKTMISAHPVLKHNYRTCFPNHIRGSACFEILGFDVMVDKRLKPFLVEVRSSICCSVYLSFFKPYFLILTLTARGMNFSRHILTSVDVRF